MSFTYSTLKTAIGDYLESSESTFTTQLPTFITEAEDRILQMVQLPEQRKNVHAFIKGYIVDAAEINKWEDSIESYPENNIWTDVSYNPYKYSSFVTDTEKPIKFARYVDMCIGVSNPVMVIEGENNDGS